VIGRPPGIPDHDFVLPGFLIPDQTTAIKKRRRKKLVQPCFGHKYKNFLMILFFLNRHRKN
jgi:hypothetical protein